MKPRITYLSPGPGDPDLIPVKAARRLGEATVVFYPESTGRDVIDRHAGKQATLRELGSGGADAVASLLEATRTHGDVVRLTSREGPWTGEIREEVEGLDVHEVEVELLPAPDSARAAALLAGVPLSSTTPVKIVSAGEVTPDNEPREQANRKDAPVLLVNYEGIPPLQRMARGLIASGQSSETPVMLVEHPTRSDQRTRTLRLGDLREASDPGRLPSRGVAVVGNAVDERVKSEWPENRPLHGVRIIVTRPQNGPDRFSRMLRRAGARVLHYPSIRIRPLPDGIERLGEEFRNINAYRWVVFTSRNGVRFFFRALEQVDGDVRSFGGVRIACIGKGTARALEKHRLTVDLIPEAYRAESLATALLERSQKGDRLLLARAGGAREVLPRRLEQKQRSVREIPLYVAEPAREYRHDLQQALGNDGVDMITFTSSSTVDNLFDLLGDPEKTRRRLNRIRCAAIGPITADTLRQRGVEVDVIPDQYDFQHLTSAITAHYRDPRRPDQNAEVTSR